MVYERPLSVKSELKGFVNENPIIAIRTNKKQQQGFSQIHYFAEEMTDVTRDNFEDLLPKIYELIESCSFIAIDTEFSALYVDSSCETR